MDLGGSKTLKRTLNNRSFIRAFRAVTKPFSAALAPTIRSQPLPFLGSIQICPQLMVTRGAQVIIRFSGHSQCTVDSTFPRISSQHNHPHHHEAMGTRRLHLSAPFLLLVIFAAAAAEAKLAANYYSKTCPRAERIVMDVVSQKQLSHPTTAAGVLRVFFHDCFVSGCDASVLVSSTPFARSERDAAQSQSLPGDAFEALTRAKTALELECPGVVSCADALALAARVLVTMTGGPLFPVRLGRKDATASSPTAPDAELPLANSTVPRLVAMFAAKGFTAQELVALSGAHTLGFSHCSEFADRIFRRKKGGGGGAAPHDPTMNPAYAKGLQDACKDYLRDPTIAAFNDVMTPGKFDNMYFVNLQRGLGLLSTDQELWSDPTTRAFVQRYAANQTAFFADFAGAMAKLSVQGVKTGRDGEVRRRCDMYNGHPVVPGG